MPLTPPSPMPSSRSLEHTIEILGAVPHFSGLDDATLRAVAEAAIRRDYGSNQVVFVEGDPSKGLYIVETGWLKVVKMSTDGREQVLHFLGPGETFNALSVFTEMTNPATVVALETSVVWLVHRETMLRLLDTHPELARVMVQKLATRVQHLISLVEDLSLRTVEARLARLLLEQGGRGMVQRRRWATQTELAARLGTVPDVLSRALRKLAAEGLIRVARHQIEILDIEGLEERAMLE
ncbi:MAG: Crp/Fnr family transcriptional regulator [Chloroflexota bacterium]|nr:Crp/Fnr family transcriptional regulator [Chloroflexota bacterium]